MSDTGTAARGAIRCPWFVWVSTCAMGTLVGGYLLSWGDIATFGAAVALRLLSLAWTWRSHARAYGGASAAVGLEYA